MRSTYLFITAAVLTAGVAWLSHAPLRAWLFHAPQREFSQTDMPAPLAREAQAPQALSTSEVTRTDADGSPLGREFREKHFSAGASISDADIERLLAHYPDLRTSIDMMLEHPDPAIRQQSAIALLSFLETISVYHAEESDLRK